MDSPGCLFGIALVALVVVLAVIGIKAASRKRRAKRTASLAAALTGGGFSVETDAEIPAEMPDWEIAPRKKRTRQAIRIDRGNATAHLFDHVQLNKGYPGWNKEVTSSGDSGTTRTYRHTLVCLHAPTLRPPSFQVIPNVREKMSGIVGAATQGLEAEGHTRSAGALGMLGGLVGSLEAARERPGALALEDQPGVMAAFKVYGDDEPAIRARLDGPLLDLLLSHPGTILEAQGTWLVTSFNVGFAFGLDPDDKNRPALGLLSPEQAIRLVELVFELQDVLG